MICVTEEAMKTSKKRLKQSMLGVSACHVNAANKVRKQARLINVANKARLKVRGKQGA